MIPTAAANAIYIIGCSLNFLMQMNKTTPSISAFQLIRMVSVFSIRKATRAIAIPEAETSAEEAGRSP